MMRWPLLAAAVLLLGALIAAACSGGSDNESRVTLATPQEFQQAISAADAFVVNVHVPYQAEIEGTDAFIPYDQVEAQADKLPPDKSAPLYIYCRSGRMSAAATPALRALGYTNIVDLQGGMDAWEAAGLPLTVRDQAPQSRMAVQPAAGP